MKIYAIFYTTFVITVTGIAIALSKAFQRLEQFNEKGECNCGFCHPLE